jgi:hypothetical protein
MAVCRRRRPKHRKVQNNPMDQKISLIFQRVDDYQILHCGVAGGRGTGSNRRGMHGSGGHRRGSIFVFCS